MARYNLEFQKQVVEKAQALGIKPLAREYGLSRNTIKRWINIYKTKGFYGLVHLHQKEPSVSKVEKFIIALKEKNPNVTLRDIQNEIKIRIGAMLSLNSIHRVLKKFGMTGKNYLPFRVASNRKNNSIIDYVRALISKKQVKEAAEVVNSVPALSDFSVLKDIPKEFLCLRRQVERLEVLWGDLPMWELYKLARALRIECSKKKHLFSAIFVASLEMNALNFLGHHNKIAQVYEKFSKYLYNLPRPLKYLFLNEYFLSCFYTPQNRDLKIPKNYLFELENFCKKLPAETNNLFWYDAVSSCLQHKGEVNKSLEWIKKILQENNLQIRNEYLPVYLFLLCTRGEYNEVIQETKKIEITLPAPLSLRAILAEAEAYLGIGKPTQALEIALDGYSKAEKAQLSPAMGGFSFFLACIYGALNEREKSVYYLKLFRLISKTKARERAIADFLLNSKPPPQNFLMDARLRLLTYYQQFSKTLRYKSYLRILTFAKRKGLLGYLHRIILLQPEPVLYLLRKGKETHLPDTLLNLPVFNKEIPTFYFYLLTKREKVFFGEKMIPLKYRTKAFALFIYLILNRSQPIPKEILLNTFFIKNTNPNKSLTKILTKIRSRYGLTKREIVSRSGNLYIAIKAKIDLEEFEKRFKIGKIFERAGETNRAIVEYQECFKLYKKSPFDWMGYYYNFAEERRILVCNMYQEICMKLLVWAKEKGDYKWVNRIRMKLKMEGLMSQEGQDGDATNF